MQPLFVSQNGQLWSLVKYTENFLRSFPQDLTASLQDLWSFFTLPTNNKNTQVKTGKIMGGGGEGFGGRVLRESKSPQHGWRASKHQLLLHQKHYSTTAKNITYLSFSKSLFLLSATLSPTSPHCHLSAVISLKKSKGRKLITSSNLRSKEATFTGKLFVVLKKKKHKSLLSLYQSQSWPLTRNMLVSPIPFCSVDANSSSHLPDRWSWGNVLRSGAGMSSRGLTMV